MKKSISLIVLSLVGLCSVSLGQDAADFVGTTLNLSMTNPGGSSRILGLGGAQTALGGDVSSISSNPAGLGFFNRSEVSFSPAFNYISTQTDYLGTSTNDSRLNLNIGNLGAVIKNPNENGKFKGAFGISINRIADFQNQITYEGDLTNQFDFIQYAVDNSFVDTSTNPVSVGDDNDDLAFLAARTFLTDVFQDQDGILFVDRDIYEVDDNGQRLQDGNGFDIPAFANEDFPTFQTETIDSRGAAYQTSFAYGGNYDDRVYFGGNIGILTFTQEVEREYIEAPTGTDLNSLVLEDNYEMNGIGINATLGLIARPIDQLLLGVSYSTPSIYGIEQIRSITLTANYLGFDPVPDGIDYDPFNYTITTPSKLNLGATYFLGKYGFITGDFERVNYAGGRLSNSESGVSFSEYNNTIDRLESVWNYRLGAEFRFDIFRVRGGYSYTADPSDDGFEQAQNSISLGGGIRTKKYFADMAVISSDRGNSLISPYPGQQAQIERSNTTVALTFGIFF